MVIESWFSGLSWISRNKTLELDKSVIGILTFEVASLMSKVANLWHCLSDEEIVKLREKTVNSIGVRKLVSENDDYLMDLALNEIIENLGMVAKSVAMLGKRCKDPVYHRFEQFINDPIRNGFQWVGWDYRLKKMDRKVRKMKNFAAVTTQLSQELELLSELQRTLRRMQADPDLRRVKLIEFQRKVICQCQEVRNLCELSPWCRTYDYIVRLLVRSLFTILERIKHVFDNNYNPCVERNDDCEHINSVYLPRSHSFSAFMHSSVHPSEDNNPGPSNSRLTADENRKNNEQLQDHLQSSKLHGKHPHLKKAHVRSFKGCMTGGGNSPILQSCNPIGSSSLRSSGLYVKNKDLPSKTIQLAPVGTFKRPVTVGSDSPLLQSCKATGGGSMRLSSVSMQNIGKVGNTNMGSSCSNRILSKLSLVIAKCSLLNAPPSTLGDAALAFHYANMIILIEKLASAPDLIGVDPRDDLYNMLPTVIRTALRARLKSFAKTSVSSVYDAVLVGEWSLALVRILEWLAPLAHNMIQWQSERNFEKQQVVSRTDVLLVNTLYFANQAKTEAAIIELLMGLNYICRFRRELAKKGNLPESASGSRVCNYRLLQRDRIPYIVL